MFIGFTECRMIRRVIDGIGKIGYDKKKGFINTDRSKGNKMYAF
jgi:hypothetical protein